MRPWFVLGVALTTLLVMLIVAVAVIVAPIQDW
jgi:hypothetical protein